MIEHLPEIDTIFLTALDKLELPPPMEVWEQIEYNLAGKPATFSDNGLEPRALEE